MLERMQAGFLSGQTVNIVPITLAEAKAWLRKTVADTDDDATITLLLSAACGYVQRITGRTIFGQSWKLMLDRFPPGALQGGWWDGVREGAESYGSVPFIKLPTTPVSLVTSVKTYDMSNNVATFDSANYTVDVGDKDQLARVILNVGCVWPVALRPFMAVEVNFEAGYATAAAPTVFTLPVEFKIVIFKVLSWLYNNRGDCDPLNAEGTVSMMPSVQQMKLGRL